MKCFPKAIHRSFKIWQPTWGESGCRSWKGFLFLGVIEELTKIHEPNSATAWFCKWGFIGTQPSSLFLYCLWLLSCYASSSEQLWQSMAHRAQYIYCLALYRKCLLTSGLGHRHISEILWVWFRPLPESQYHNKASLTNFLASQWI